MTKYSSKLIALMVVVFIIAAAVAYYLQTNSFDGFNASEQNSAFVSFYGSFRYNYLAMGLVLLLIVLTTLFVAAVSKPYI